MAALVANLALLSQVSGFDATHVKSLNWEIVVMLTPYGLFNNFWLKPGHYLRPYYQNPVTAYEPLTLLLSSVTATMALVLIVLCRKASK